MADALYVRNLVGCAEPFEFARGLRVILILSSVSSQSDADGVAERDGTVDGQQPYPVAEVSAVIIKKLHTFEKLICLFGVLLGRDWAYVPQPVLL